MWWIASLLACSSAPAPSEIAFVRDGLIVPADEGRPLPDGRRLVERPWTAGDLVRIGAVEATAPAMAECVSLFSVPLGDVSAHIARGGEAPDTALAFSPDGSQLAIGTFRGEILVADGWTGEVIARRRLAEGMVKRVAWSADGDTLYAAEQSPDALVLALDPHDLTTRASLRLADEVGTSAPPHGDDLYGVYTLPAAYGLEIRPDGDLVVAATHAWDDGGTRRNRARVLRLRPDLSIRAAWPADGPADAVFRSLHVGGDTVAVPVGRSADGPASDQVSGREPSGSARIPASDLPVGGVQVLDGDLKPVRALRIDPLQPWFKDAFVWEAVAVGPDGRLAVGLGDGRVVIEGQGTVPLGAPVLAGEVPIVTSIGQLAWPEQILVVTARTNIPWGAARPELRPPEAHPAENALTALRPDGSTAWSWRGPQVLQGLTVSADGRWVVVGAGARDTDDRTDLFGALVFEGRDLAAWCPTEGPVFFRHAIAPDGRIAVAEFPFRTAGGLGGAYRVTVLR